MEGDCRIIGVGVGKYICDPGWDAGMIGVGDGIVVGVLISAGGVGVTVGVADGLAFLLLYSSIAMRRASVKTCFSSLSSNAATFSEAECAVPPPSGKQAQMPD